MASPSLGLWSAGSSITHWVTRFPRGVRSWHLTLLTVPWSAGTIAFGWLAGERPVWLWAMSVMVAAQWFTDSFDGTLGKTRGEGLVRWGFFMDHFLDTVFAGSVVIGYSFIAPGGAGLLLQLLLLVTCSMMALSSLAFAATNECRIAFYGVGPTEVRIGYIALNAFVFLAGPGARCPPARVERPLHLAATRTGRMRHDLASSSARVGVEVIPCLRGDDTPTYRGRTSSAP